MRGIFQLGIAGLALAAAFASTGCVNRAAQEQSKRTEKLVSDTSHMVESLTVSTQTLEDTLEITGSTATSDDTQVGAKQNGKLLSVLVNDGDAVVANQVIAMQDTANLQAQLQQAMAQASAARATLSQAISNATLTPQKTSSAVNSALSQLRSAQSQLQKALNGARPEERRQAQANLDSAKTNLNVAQAELARIEKLVTEGAIAGNRLDQQQNVVAAATAQYRNAQEVVALQQAGSRKEDIDSARELVRQAQEAVKNARAAKSLDVLLTDQVDSAKANLQSAMAQVNIVQQNISDMTIRAPMAGRIMGKPAQPGQIVGPGAVVARIVGLGATYFEGNIPEYQLGKVAVGKPVTVGIDALGKQTFPGHVAAISPVGGSVGRLFAARIEIDGKPSEVRPGMFAHGVMVINTVPNAILVPSRAVVTSDGSPAVFVVDGTKAKRIPVTVGVTKGDMVQVTGLSAGAQVIVKGQEGLNDGSVIKIEKPAAQAAGVNEG